MKISALVILSGITGMAAGWSQVVPATPKNFKMRPIGNSAEVGATIDQVNSNQNARYISHIALSESRIWTNTEGKPLEAKLIAFEDLIAEAPKGAPVPPMPAAPPNPTLIKDGKVRLFADQKPFLVLLKSLSQQDQDFIESIKSAIASRKASPR